MNKPPMTDAEMRDALREAMAIWDQLSFTERQRLIAIAEKQNAAPRDGKTDFAS